MAVEGCTKCLKWLLFVFNLFFFAIGVTVLALGAWIYVEFDSFLSELGGAKYLNGPILFIAVGSIITIISFLGCCGACKEIKCMLYLFAILMTITFILELVGGILAVTNDFGDKLQDTLKDSTAEYEDNSAVREAWDTVQKNLDCCGVDNKTDWFSANWSQGLVPESCCETTLCKTNATKLPTFDFKVTDATSGVYDVGCFKKIKDKYEDNSTASAVVAITFAVLQILGIIIACFVGCKIDKDDD
jgi:hypothetical protein